MLVSVRSSLISGLGFARRLRRHIGKICKDDVLCKKRMREEYFMSPSVELPNWSVRLLPCQPDEWPHAAFEAFELIQLKYWRLGAHNEWFCQLNELVRSAC